MQAAAAAALASEGPAAAACANGRRELVCAHCGRQYVHQARYNTHVERCGWATIELHQHDPQAGQLLLGLLHLRGSGQRPQQPRQKQQLQQLLLLLQQEQQEQQPVNVSTALVKQGPPQEVSMKVQEGEEDSRRNSNSSSTIIEVRADQDAMQQPAKRARLSPEAEQPQHPGLQHRAESGKEGEKEEDGREREGEEAEDEEEEEGDAAARLECLADVSLEAAAVAAALAAAAQPKSRPATAGWQQKCAQLAAFVAEHGRLPLPHGDKKRQLTDDQVQERQLSAWCSVQRERKRGQRHSRLSIEQEAALEEIPGWHWGRAALVWEERLAEVAAFQQQHGRLPRSSGSSGGNGGNGSGDAGEGAGSGDNGSGDTGDGDGGGNGSAAQPSERQLSAWCAAQRQLHSAGKLSEDRQQALEGLPGWRWESDSDASWQSRLSQLAEFQQQHGRLPRQTGSQRQPLEEGEGSLARWCSRQRQKAKQGQLSLEQQAALDELPGWGWELDGDAAWQAQLAEVAAFQQQYGRQPRQNGSQKQPLEEGEAPLARWCSRQRQLHRTGRLSTERQQAVEEGLPGWRWESDSDATWQARIAELAAFLEQHGRMPRQSGSQRQPLEEGEGPLARWCSRQQHKSKRGQLPAEQQAALEELPGWGWGAQNA